MSRDFNPCEGSIFIMSYTECDYDDEGTAALAYVLKNGVLKPLLGVMSLPDGASFNNHDSSNYDAAVAVVLEQQVTHVFAPSYNIPGIDFYGQSLGFTELSEVLNEQGELECWIEFGSFLHNWEFIARLEALQIKVIYVDPETKKTRV